MKAQIWVDFNEIDERGRTLTTRRLATTDADLSVGERILVGDYEGNLCSGEIVDLRAGDIVEIALDLDTFTHGDAVGSPGRASPAPDGS